MRRCRDRAIERKHVRPSSLILIVAVVMGAVAAFLARNWLQSHTGETIAKSATLVVATAPLGFGTSIAEDKIAEIPWVSSDLPEGAFATKRDLLKDGRRVVLSQIDRNEPVLRSKITAPGQRGSLSTLLDSGKRAVTVRVDDVRGVAGFILPGDRVDVALIRMEASSAGSHSYSDVILQSVKVLAVDQVVSERPEQASVIAKAVTLEVTADEAQKVLLATNIGKLSLILRQPIERNSEPTRRVTERDLAFVEPVPAPAPAPVAVPVAVPVRQPETSTVTIIRNMKREEYTVRRTN
jgi:pilus assembly protein CpaB